MLARLVALDEGSDVPLDRAMIVVGRHPQCDVRLDSLRVSRHHCCMTHDHGEVLVRDLGSTNGIRINGQRVELGRLRAGDELSIAHIRYRLDDGLGHEATLVDRDHDSSEIGLDPDSSRQPYETPEPVPVLNEVPGEHRLAAAVRELLPSGLADRCHIQVIVQVPGEAGIDHERGAGAVEKLDACRPDSSH